MNHFYGVRFPQSFKSDEAWYEINAYGGKALLIAAVPIFAVGLFGLLAPAFSHYPLISSAIVLLSVMSACLMSYLKARKVDALNRQR